MVLLQCSDVPKVERGSAAAQARARIAGDTGRPWGLPFWQLPGSFVVLWSHRS